MTAVTTTGHEAEHATTPCTCTVIRENTGLLKQTISLTVVGPADCPRHRIRTAPRRFMGLPLLFIGVTAKRVVAPV